MTSNQVSWAMAQESARHNAKMEEIEAESNRITEQRDKVNKQIQIANVLLSAADEFNKVGTVANASTKNALEAQKVALEAWSTKQGLELKRKDQELQESANFELAQHYRRQDRYNLRNVENQEYLATLQSKMNQMTVSNWLVQNEHNIAQLELEKSKVSNEAFRNDLAAYSTLFEGYYKMAQSKHLKNQDVVNIISAANETLKSLNSTVSTYMLLAK